MSNHCVGFDSPPPSVLRANAIGIIDFRQFSTRHLINAIKLRRFEDINPSAVHHPPRARTMALFDRIKYDASDDTELVWKFPSDAIPIGSQLVVTSTQECVFRKGGRNADLFPPGTHTISSANLPILGALINLPFGGKTPFTAEVWYVSKAPKRDLKWGTSAPIPLIEPKYGVPINVRALGQWGIRIVDALAFLEEMVGTRKFAASDQVYEYFRGELVQGISEVIATDISSGKASLFEINAMLASIAQRTATIFGLKLNRYGIELTNFSIDRISIPQDEMQKLQTIMLKRMEVEQLGSAAVTDNYKAAKTFDVLQTAAENEGGGIAPLMAQAGLGAALGANAAIQAAAINANSNKGTDVEVRLGKLKNLLDKSLITQAEYDAKKSQLLDEL